MAVDGHRRRTAASLLAVDGGGSKVDAVLVGRDGAVERALRFRNTDHDGTSSDAYLDGVELAVEALRAAARPDGSRSRTWACTASPAPTCRPTTAASPGGSRRADWTRTDVVRNDTFAVLRAGTDRTWGVAVVCGYGTNCSAVAPDGRTFRFPAVGDVSGDWGGGHDIGSAALWYALRAQDGRGERTALERSSPQHFGLRRPRQVMEAMYFGRMPSERVVELPPVVFRRRGGRRRRRPLDRRPAGRRGRRHGGRGHPQAAHDRARRRRRAGRRLFRNEDPASTRASRRDCARWRPASASAG